jgi:hypothetical protein
MDLRRELSHILKTQSENILLLLWPTNGDADVVTIRSSKFDRFTPFNNGQGSRSARDDRKNLHCSSEIACTLLSRVSKKYDKLILNTTFLNLIGSLS